MGKFDGYLICSDFDGTFSDKGEPVAENVDAVRYFTENGGKFTIATGRTVKFIREMGLLPIINAPACLFNGSVIYDYRNEEVLRESHVDFTLGAFLDAVGEATQLLQCLYVFSSVDGGSSNYEDLKDIGAEELGMHPMKVVCRCRSEEAADEFKRSVCGYKLFADTCIAKSWSTGVEFNAANATKGHALRFIKEYLGNIHTAVGIGDYENDVPLIKMADIGVAVGNAMDCVKQCADLVVKPNKEGAVRNLIEKLVR